MQEKFSSQVFECDKPNANKRIYPKHKVKLRDAIVTRWAKDDFALGSYSFKQIGCT